MHFAETAVEVNKDQSLVLKKGNWLWTELLDTTNMLAVKFEELMLYLLQKYGRKFEIYIHSLMVEEERLLKVK